MKISINIDDKYKDTEISVCCNQLTPEIEKMISVIRIFDMQITGKKGGEIFILNAADVIYIDTVDKKTFLYTSTDVYESGLKLYELEDRLEQMDFVRIGKSCILNMKHIVSLKGDLNRRIKVTMTNQEQLIISRQYAEGIKKRLGVN